MTPSPARGGIIDTIGHTPLMRLRIPERPRVLVYAKLELQNLFAMKDRVARGVLLAARADGTLQPGAPVIESSSGTMALGLALVGRALEHPVHIVTDPRIDPVTLTKLTALGCQVHVVSRMTGAGWQSARLELLARLLDELPGAFWPRQYSNPQNPLAYRSLADELLQAVDRIDVLVGAVGSGGSLSGTAKALRSNGHDPQVIGVDAVGSMIFAQPDQPGRRQSGLGNSMQPGNVDYQAIDEVHWLSDAEAFAATAALAAEQQLFAGNTSGSVYRVLRWAAADAADGAVLVGILPDRGDRYTDSVYADRARAEPADPALPQPQLVNYGHPVSTWSRARLPRPRPDLVFIESNTTGSGMLALSTARRLGTHPILLTADKHRYRDVTATGCELVTIDTDDPAAIAATLAGRPVPPAGILTTSEYFLPVVSRIATDRQLRSNPPDAVDVLRNKARTRDLADVQRLTQPRFALVSADRSGWQAGAREAASAVGLPCVVKPVLDSGSNLVRRCATTDEVIEHLDRVFAVTHNVRGQPVPRAALIEQLVPGTEYSVEMFSLDGQHHLLGVTEKAVTGDPHFVEYQHLFPAALDGELIDRLANLATSLLDGAGFRWGASHLEIMVADGQPFLIEANARLAGGMIPELIRLATGVDVLEQHLRAFCELPVHLAAVRAMVAGIRFLLPDRAGRFAGVGGAADARALPGVDRVVVTCEPGQPIAPPHNAYGRIGYVIATGQSGAQVRDTLAAAVGLLDVVLDDEGTNSHRQEGR